MSGIIVVASLIGIAVGKVAVQSYFDQRRATAFDHSLVDASSQWNAKLPLQVDKYTRLDWTVPGPGKRFTCMCTLLGISAKEIDPTKLTSIMRPQIVNGYKTIPQLAPFRDQGVEMRYVYRDAAGKYVTEIVISPKDFQ